MSFVSSGLIHSETAQVTVDAEETNRNGVSSSANIGSFEEHTTGIGWRQMCTGCKAIAMPCRHRWRHWWWKRRKASSSGRSKYLARVSMTKWNKSLKEMECTRLWTLKLDWSMLKVLVRIILTSGENQCHENHSHQNLVSYVQKINILCIVSSIKKGGVCVKF